MGKKHGRGIYIVGGIAVTAAVICLILKLQKELADRIYRKMI